MNTVGLFLTKKFAALFVGSEFRFIGLYFVWNVDFSFRVKGGFACDN